MAIRYSIILVLSLIVAVPCPAQQPATTKKSGELPEFNLWRDEGIKNTDKKVEPDEKTTNGRPLLKVDINDIEPSKPESTDTTSAEKPVERVTPSEHVPEIDLNKEVPEQKPESGEKTTNGRPLLKVDINDIEPSKPESTDTTSPEKPVEQAIPSQPVPEIDLDKELSEPEIEQKVIPVGPDGLAELRDAIAQIRVELDQLRQKVDQIAAVQSAGTSKPAAPSSEPQLHVRTEREPFYPFWLPQR